MPSLLEKKASELDEIVGIVHDIQEKASKDDRDLTDVEKDRIRSLGEMVEKLKEECSFLNDQVVSERAWSKLRADIESNRLEHEEIQQQDRHPSHRRTGMEIRSWGEAFTESDAFKTYHGGGTSQRVTMPLNLERRAEIKLADLDLPPMMWTPPQYTYASPLLDVVGKVTTGSNSVTWVEWTPNPMAAAALTAEGAAKTEAAMTATPSTGTLGTYATWKGITRQALEDAPYIRSLVENRLRQSVLVALENAVVTELTGATGIPPVTGSGAAGDTLLGVIRAGIATVQAAGFATPNAILINPADAADIDAALMAGTMNGAVVNGTYWGVKVVPSMGVPPGTAFVGDFSVGITLFNRGQTDVYLTDSHADYFIRNILLILAETRALATTPEPAAMAKCTVGAVE